MPDTPLILRALELARTGRFSKVTEIRLALKAEGYSRTDSYLEGGGIRRQLRGLIVAARSQHLAE